MNPSKGTLKMFLGAKGGKLKTHFSCIVYGQFFSIVYFHTCQFFSIEIVHVKMLWEFLFGKGLSLSQIHHFAEQGSQKPFTATFKANYQFIQAQALALSRDK
jgi:hypothetical protein